MVKEPIDLSSLALDRSPALATTRKPPLQHKNRWISRVVLPFGVLLGFAILLATAAGTRFVPARSVTVVPVIVKRIELQQAGAIQFQAPGWIEPRPTAIGVAAMTHGVIEELMVVAGQRVQKGQPIAKLVSIDAELVLEQSKNALAIRDGDLNRAKAELSAARIRFDNPVHLRIQLADAKSNLAKSKTELAKIPFLIEAAGASAKYTLGSMTGKQSAKGSIPDNTIAKAENDHAMATANLQELQQRKPNLEREVSALEEVVHALERQSELLVEETRQLQEAEAKVQSAEAYRNEAKLQVRQAELALDRNTVRAPMDGRILRLVAAPGSRVMGLETTAGQSSSTVAEMYDPQKLQLRVDVRLEDVPLVTPGQPVEIETASSNDVIHGQVLQITSSANIQKNTLEVKVELLDPPSTVSPEMLVTASFLVPKIEALTNSSSESERVLVPSSLIQSVESGSYVWIVDESSTARKRSVELGGKAEADLVAIKSGLRVTDKIIASGLHGLRDGTRVNVTSDDPIIGIK